MAKWKQWRLMPHGWWQWQLPWTRAVVFWRDSSKDMLLMSKTSPAMTRKGSIEIPQISRSPSKCLSTRVANDASWLTKMAVVMDSHRHLPKRSLERHIADVKNIAGNDQPILRVDRNSANIAYTIKIYVYEIATNALRLMAASEHCSNCVLPRSKTSPAMTR